MHQAELSKPEKKEKKELISRYLLEATPETQCRVHKP